MNGIQHTARLRNVPGEMVNNGYIEILKSLSTHEGFQSLFILLDQSIKLLVIVLQTVVFFGHCGIHSL